MSAKDTILKQIAENPLIIYMKGVPTAPECGFSAKAVEILNASKISYAYVDVLKAPFIRDKLPSISKWPTFPQLFVNGELLGGCDIIETMALDGSLLPILEAAVAQQANADGSTVISHSEVETIISATYPDAIIAIEGQGCDLTVTVVSEQFAGLSMVKQHQRVMACLSEALASGRLHALSVKTFTPEHWQAKQASHSGLLQIQL